MKILLLNPPAPDKRKFIREGRCTQEQGVWATLWPPLSLATMGAVVEDDGHLVKIVDCPAEEMSLVELGRVIRDYVPDLVVWSTGTPSIDSDLELAAFIKGCDDKVTTAVFGTHVTVFDRVSLEQFPAIDCIIRNEPEMTLAAVASALREGGGLGAVAGVTVRAGTGAIVANPSRRFIEDLDSLPLPAWHLLNLDRYRLPLKGKRFLMVAPLRGCPFKCIFCTCQTYYGQGLRKRSVESVLNEIEYDSGRFGVRDFFFWAETFVIDRTYVAELCRGIIERGLAISWTSNSRVDTVDKGLLSLMAQAGCWMISYGIESGSQEILDKAGKGTTVEQAVQAVQYAREAGIKTVGHFILGLPGETKASLKHTIRFARNLPLDLAQFYCAVPFPGSRLYERARKEGWITRSAFSCFKQDSALMELPTITTGEVNRYRKLAYMCFYSHPRRMAATLKLIDWKDLGRALTAAKDFWRWSNRCYL